MRTTIEFGSADLLIATQANIFPRTLSVGAPHVVVTSTSGKVRPIAIAASNPLRFTRGPWALVLSAWSVLGPRVRRSSLVVAKTQGRRTTNGRSTRDQEQRTTWLSPRQRST